MLTKMPRTCRAGGLMCTSLPPSSCAIFSAVSVPAGSQVPEQGWGAVHTHGLQEANDWTPTSALSLVPASHSQGD